MKVSQNLPPTAQSVEQAKANPIASAKGKSTAPVGTADGASKEVEISDNARLMKQASDIAKSTPDLRADKIAQLKKAIQNGTYQVDAKSVAEKLLDEHLGTDFGKNNL